MSTLISRVNSQKNYLGAMILGAAVVSLILSFAVAPRSAHALTTCGTADLCPVSISSNNISSSTLAHPGDVVTISFTASSSLSVVPTVTINGGPTTLSSTTGNVYTAATTTSAATATGLMTFSISDSLFSGATTTTTNGTSVTFDGTPPTLLHVGISSSRGTTTPSIEGDTLTVTATSSEPIGIPVIKIDGKTATVLAVFGSTTAPAATGTTTWKGSVTLALNDPGSNASSSLSITFADLAGNVGTVTATNDNSSVLLGSIGQLASNQNSNGSTGTGGAGGSGGGGIVGSGPQAVGFVVGGGVPGVYLGVGSSTTSTTYGPPVNGMTENQVQSILSLLTSFGADPTVINNVNASLHGVSTGGTTSSAWTYTFTRNLTIGSTGSDVKELQMYLNMHGYPLASSGAGSPGMETSTFGSLTRSALSKFQAAMGITPTAGYFGPVTRAKISGGGSAIPNTTTTTTTTITPPPTPATMPLMMPVPTSTTTSTTTTTTIVTPNSTTTSTTTIH